MMHHHWVPSFLLLLLQLATSIPLATASFLLVDHPGHHRRKLTQRASSSSSSTAPSVTNVPKLLPARQPLPFFFNNDDNDKAKLHDTTNNNCFSLMSWNILLPNSQDNWWCHKQYSNNVDMDKRQWTHRHKLIKERVLTTAADIVCIQEADGDTFDDDFDFMKVAGYDHVLHRKFRFRCVTFFLRDKFAIEKVAHKDRTLVTSLRRLTSTLTSTVMAPNDTIGTTTQEQNHHDHILHIVNCHLSGGAAPERRLRQVHDGLDQIRKWTNALEHTLTQQRKGKRPSPKNIAKAKRALDEYQNNAGTIVCGDFNSDGNTAVRKLLVEGGVESDWYEPQYPNLRLTSKRKEQSFGTFVDAAELAYGVNVCDGDYAELQHSLSSSGSPSRPATYVVPNLASLLLLPMGEGGSPPRTEFGMQIARGLADTLNLDDFSLGELDRAFDLADHDGNGLIDLDEGLTLLESVYVATYGQQIEQERNNFFRGFGTHNNHDDNKGGCGLTKEQFITRLKSLQQDCEGERKAFGLARGLNLHELSEAEMEQSFNDIDLDGNGLLDEDEFQTLLENVYVAIYGEEIEKQRTEFFVGFQKTGNNGTSGTPDSDSNELTREQFTERLLALHQELEGGRKGAECAEVRTEADVQKMIERFTPLLQCALDEVFDKFSSNGATLSQEEVNAFLIKTNGEVGRGGTFRHTSAIFEKKKMETSSSSKPAELTRSDWHGVFARELAEGKWWQVVYDLEVCGFNVTSEHSSNNQFYQGWLDYIYLHGLRCTGVQDALTEEERMRIYDDGDALPNEWHPSDHLPVSAIFSWS
mmetsp:Transcript_21531/g.46820  ORF Transcript_21531/g.46820 Transcript_21531/m.46820 type:complete len:808 (-) Transcript_21531:543-2966(-)